MPVRAECLAAALERCERNGIWGGRVFGAKPACRVEVA